jgi:hypothetical protein
MFVSAIHICIASVIDGLVIFVEPCGPCTTSSPLSIAIVCFVADGLSSASGVGTTWLASGAEVNVSIVHTGT